MTRSPAQVPTLDVIYHLRAAAPYMILVRSQCMYDLSPSSSSLTQRAAQLSHTLLRTREIYLYHLLLCMHMTNFQIQYHGNGCDQSKPQCHRPELWSAISSINVSISQVTHLAILHRDPSQGTATIFRGIKHLFTRQGVKICTDLMTEAVWQ